MQSWKTVVLGLSLAAFAPLAAGQAADQPAHKSQFAKEHPRRAEVNHRVGRQRHELKEQLKSGKITQAQYDAENAKLNTIKSEERADVKANGGHLTKDQQKGINGELNQTHQEIKSEGGTPVQ